MSYRYKYGILDDEGAVVRWVYDQPSAGYEFVTVKITRSRRPSIDWSRFEAAPF